MVLLNDDDIFDDDDDDDDDDIVIRMYTNKNIMLTSVNEYVIT